jgi:hypothetical protein
MIWVPFRASGAKAGNDVVDNLAIDIGFSLITP